MKGKKVEIVLHTPILLEVGEEGARKTETIAKIRAQISDTAEGGLWLELQELRNERGQKISPPGATMFLPLHKVDHIFTL